MHLTLEYKLNCMSTTGILVLIRLLKKADLLETKVNCTKIERFMLIKISFDLGKNGCHRPSGLGGRLIVVVNK